MLLTILGDSTFLQACPEFLATWKAVACVYHYSTSQSQLGQESLSMSVSPSKPFYC